MKVHYWLLSNQGFFFIILAFFICLSLAISARLITRKSVDTDIIVDKIIASKLYSIFMYAVFGGFLIYAIVVSVSANLDAINIVKKHAALFKTYSLIYLSFFFLQYFILTIICFFIASFKKSKDD